ncbi:MAG: GYF domain-containing protein [Planctomycetota bacterium]|nr:GYF domain-containing protein [Planctomycetota bacterium]
MAEPKRFYCQMLGQELGPMMLSDVMVLIRNSEVTSSDLVREGDGAWVPAGQIEKLQIAFETQLAPAVAPARSSQRSGKPKQSTKTGTTTKPAPAATVTASAPAASTVWFCRIQGKEYGPIDDATLVQWVTERRLLAENEVRKGDAGDWFTVQSVPDLAKHATGRGQPVAQARPAASTSPATKPASSTPQSSPAAAKSVSPAAKPNGEKAKPQAVQPSPVTPPAADSPFSPASEFAASPPSPTTPVAPQPTVNPVIFSTPKSSRSFKDLANIDVDDVIQFVMKPQVIGAIAVIAVLAFTGPWVLKKVFAASPQPIYDRFEEIGAKLKSMHDNDAADAEIEAYGNEVLPELEQTLKKLEVETQPNGDLILRSLFYAGSYSLVELFIAKEERRQDLWMGFDGDMMRAKFMLEGMSEEDASIKASEIVDAAMDAAHPK